MPVKIGVAVLCLAGVFIVSRSASPDIPPTLLWGLAVFFALYPFWMTWFERNARRRK